ncbi:MAG: bifunctional demethylmenaquinone methyltransferase/2-methoxy-6-polyprenyl-1,4-benzoquinol methylase UbiE [Bacteroidetes bacterium]|nr:bifunctional demethylmenaquinone methyltransferase/2-methoxy-6-polyprenyl-1,4-benzoquinol methylase UbiE [Bacteroidota bacterium]
MIQTNEDEHRPVVVPNAQSNLGKKKQVAEMFDGIAGRYDFLNHFLSLGIDKIWRNIAIREVAQHKPNYILDVATGTGDMAINASGKLPQAHIIGMDISTQMLEEGRKKIKKLGLEQTIVLQEGDSENLPFSTGQFDVVMCAYGVRNFENLTIGLQEMNRVLRAGGKVVILEFSQPKRFPVAQLYRFYFKHILPGIGKLVSRHSQAYTYLPASVAAFPEGEKFVAILSKCGFEKANARPLSFGITTLYTAFKKA